MDKSGYLIFQQESAEIAAAFNKLIEAIAKPSALDHKTKHLIYIAMKIVTGDQGAALAHVPLMKKPGASRENCGKPSC
jgi:alkylhydroperoxidase/carboxymuconolactone decarboxylase family protein YurZ